MSRFGKKFSWKSFCLFLVVIPLVVGMTTVVEAKAVEGTPDIPAIQTPKVIKNADNGAVGFGSDKEIYEQNITSYSRPDASLGKSTSDTLFANFVSLTCMLAGCTSEDGSRTAAQDLASAPTGHGGLLGTTFQLIARTYTPPAATSVYIADVAGEMGISTPVQAQGYGYYSLQSVLDLWKVFRNIAYIFFTIIIIFIGFVILFRQKVGGQAVVTVQQALPRIVMALVLVTFSYAIAGFLVDMMYLIMYLFLTFFEISPESERNNLVGGGFMYLMGRIMGGAQGASWEMVFKVIEGFGLGGNLGSLLILPTLTIVGGVVLSLIMVIVAIVGSFRVLFVLLASYISFLLNLIFAPIILMTGAIPGTKTFKTWFMSMVGELSAFLVVFFLLVIQQVLSQKLGGIITVNSGAGAMTVHAADSAMFTPPYLAFSGVAGESIGALVSLGILLSMPNVVKKVKQKLGAGGGIFGEMAGAAMASVKSGARKPMALAKTAAKWGGERVGGAVVGEVLGGTKTYFDKWKETESGQRAHDKAKDALYGRANEKFSQAEFDQQLRRRAEAKADARVASRGAYSSEASKQRAVAGYMKRDTPTFQTEFNDAKKNWIKAGEQQNWVTKKMKKEASRELTAKIRQGGVIKGIKQFAADYVSSSDTWRKFSDKTRLDYVEFQNTVARKYADLDRLDPKDIVNRGPIVAWLKEHAPKGSGGDYLTREEFNQVPDGKKQLMFSKYINNRDQKRG